MSNVKAIKRSIRQLAGLYEVARLSHPVRFKEMLYHEELSGLLLPALVYLPSIVAGINGYPSFRPSMHKLDWEILESFKECSELAKKLGLGQSNDNVESLPTLAEKTEQGASKVTTISAKRDSLNDRRRLAVSIYLLLEKLRLDLLDRFNAKGPRSNWIAHNLDNLVNLIESIRTLNRYLRSVYNFYNVGNIGPDGDIEIHLGAYLEEDPSMLDYVDAQILEIRSFVLKLYD